MSLNANKGEWSEFYAFLKILSDGILYSGDEKLALIPDSFLKILRVIRKEGDKNIFYLIRKDENKIIIEINQEIVGEISLYEITTKLSTILEKIKKGPISKGTFPIPEAKVIMKELKCSKMKSPSLKKEDIKLEIDEERTKTNAIREFSIKSKIGAMPTLLNASGATNFEFEIIEGKLNLPEGKKKSLIALDKKISISEELRFIRISNNNFEKNLMMIDSQMPEILATMVKGYYSGFGVSISDLTQYITQVDPLKLDGHESFYIYKIQEFLLAVALKMQPNKLWNGFDEIQGGYIVVKENGELACYHVYDRNKFKNFLFVNTKLETPSTTRHKFGEIYKIDEKKYIKLNLQIRFKN